jgi:hypothetical protein
VHKTPAPVRCPSVGHGQPNGYMPGGHVFGTLPTNFREPPIARLSGKSEQTLFWGPKSLQKGGERHSINVTRYRNNPPTDPSGYYPDSL